MDNNNNQSAIAADEVATEFMGSLFAEDTPTTPEPMPTPASTERSAEAEQIVIVPISELEPFP